MNNIIKRFVSASNGLAGINLKQVSKFKFKNVFCLKCKNTCNTFQWLSPSTLIIWSCVSIQDNIFLHITLMRVLISFVEGRIKGNGYTCKDDNFIKIHFCLDLGVDGFWGFFLSKMDQWAEKLTGPHKQHKCSPLKKKQKIYLVY